MTSDETSQAQPLSDEALDQVAGAGGATGEGDINALVFKTTAANTADAKADLASQLKGKIGTTAKVSSKLF